MRTLSAARPPAGLVPARARGMRVPARLAAPAAMADVAILLSADYDSCAYTRRDLR